VEAVSGVWDTNGAEGEVMVITGSPVDVELECGDVVAAVHAAVVQTRVCDECGTPDTDAGCGSSGRRQR